jgi:hypothetical protein
MRANIIVGLISFAGSIVLAILASTITQYEGWFWGAAVFCLISAICVGAQPIVSRGLLAHSGLPKGNSHPSVEAVVQSDLDRTRDQSACDNKRDIWLRDAMWWAFLRTWHIPEGGMVPLNAGESENQRFAMLVMDEFRQLSFEGKLPLWGRRNGSFIWEPIPPEFWALNHIDYIAVLSADAPEDIKARAEDPWKKPDTSGDWRHFMTSNAVIEQLYPRLQ